MFVNVMLFIKAALPWIAIGLFLAVSVTASQKNKDGSDTEAAKTLNKIQWVPAVAFLFVAALEFSDGDTNRATTSLVLAIVMSAMAFANYRKAKEE